MLTPTLNLNFLLRGISLESVPIYFGELTAVSFGTLLVVAKEDSENSFGAAKVH